MEEVGEEELLETIEMIAEQILRLEAKTGNPVIDKARAAKRAALAEEHDRLMNEWRVYGL